MRESKIREALKARVEAYGGEIRAVSWLGRRNAPDVLALLPTISKPCAINGRVFYGRKGRHVFIETKRPGKDVTEAQAREHERMRAAGCVVVMVRNMAELHAWLSPL